VGAAAQRDLNLPGNRRAAGGADDLQHGGDVVHQHLHTVALAGVVAVIGCLSCQHVPAIDVPGRVPVHRPAIRAVLVGTDGRAIDEELDPRHGAVIRRRRYDGRDTRNRAAIRRAGDAHRRRGRVGRRAVIYHHLYRRVVRQPRAIYGGETQNVVTVLKGAGVPRPRPAISAVGIRVLKDATYPELYRGDTAVRVAGAGLDGDHTRDSLQIHRGDEAHIGPRVIHRDGDAVLRRVAGGVGGDRLQRVLAIEAL